MNLLSEILSSQIRAEIFRILFGVEDKEIHMRKIKRCSGFSIGTVQQELKKLIRLDLLKRRKDGNRLYYRANKEHPLYNEIHRIVLKTVGLVSSLFSSLKQNKSIKFAFVFGSIASNEEKALSDIDLMVIGNISLRKLTSLISGLSDKIGREINPHVLTKKEFIKRKISKDHFITNVFKSQKLFIIGDKNGFETMVKK